MEHKVAVYICTGCGIGDALDIEELGKVATSENSVPICKTHPNLCSQEGVELIKSDIAGEGANTLAIAACSPRVMYDAFDFENCIVDRVNIREQVVWCQKPNDEDTQMMAEDYLRMSLAKVEKMELPEPYQPEQEVSKNILVVGGGLSGMTSALEGAKAGYSVVLVEKEAQLGGFQNNVKQKVTFPYKDVQDNDIDNLIAAVTGHDKIAVYTGANIEKTSGAPGLFDVSIKANGSTVDHKVGAIVLAAGWKPYDPTKLDEKLAFGASDNVITNAMFEEMFKEEKIARPSDKQDVKNAAFLQCAGQRDPNHLPYCSSICCLTALRQACQVKAQNPDANVYVVYKELRTPGQAEDFYRKAQEDGITFIRCQDPEVKASGNQLTVEADDELLGEKVVLEDLDMVVLATGMVPVTAFGQDFSMEETEEGEEEKKKEEEEEDIIADIIRRSDILNLEYRQGPELPALRNDFPDSHFICFPYETRRTGIYAAGCVRRPMSTATAMEDATGAIMKAIQCVELTSRGAAVHPRVGDLSFPELFMQRCTQCKRCTMECPFGAYNEDEKANPLPNPTRCRRCGICMGSCPERIISFKNYSVDMIGSMIKAIEVPEEDEEKPRVLMLVCENDAYPALDMTGLKRMELSPYIRVIPLRCLGSINLVWIADALSKGIDGIILFGCRPGDDYQCHFITGSELAQYRLAKIAETLDRLVLESERVRVEEIAIIDWERIPEIVEEFMETIEEVGPNPYKGW
ncbi:MAG: hydrogenase iron-sulfur subunit [Deltaproteobacteria bacterium]|nr:hydrogenase iron-sulfur subunit [Deltaproteobacteria bacterium]MBW2139856.1 hydrogenase iron-sulfur subunit [Deltaproteobacteria bacterium]MBW2322020.1 hydrogenase iron-sulfur subunit [Deltaproteobacteria bacterium]